MVRFLAHFDGTYLQPDEPVDLPQGKALQVTVEELPPVASDLPPVASDLPPLNLAAFFDAIEAEVGLADGPEVFSVEHDHYLSGAPKRKAPDGQ